jgi:ligand-binding SRPBCC domain-containing protein
MLLGEAATIVLNSQRVFPKRLLDDGFEFRHRDLADALKAAIVDSQTQIETLTAKSPQPCAPQSPYLQECRPRYLLNTQIVLNAPVEEVFTFFSRPENLGAITPPELSFSILDDIGDIQEGTVIHYAINMGALALTWKTQIAQWKPQTRFVDSQTKGPYSSWWHEHHFLPDGDRTIMEDRVYYTPPFGLLGQLVNRFFITSKLRHIFKFRYDAMEMRFGTSPPSSRNKRAIKN